MIPEGGNRLSEKIMQKPEAGWRSEDKVIPP
jgi:hypothetical protein